jgi:outer membrane protein assembly factor BamB
VVNGVHPASCRAGNPSAFTNAFKPVGSGSPTSYNLAGLPILSVTSDGDVLAAPRSVPGRLDLISPAGSVTTLYKTTDVPLGQGESAMITAAQGDSHWVEFAVSIGYGQLDVRRLAVLDRASGAVTAFRSLPVNSPIIVLPPVLFQGAVYWTEVDSGGSGSVFRYDPATGRTDTIGSGTLLSPPTLIGGGLYWQQGGQVVTYRPGRIPAGYPLGAPKLRAPVTDGTTSVWATNAGAPPDVRIELMLSRPGMTAPIAVYQTPADGFADPLAVAGPFVIWQDTTSLVVLDTRTGATATPFPVSGPEFIAAEAGGTILAVNQIGSKGGAQLVLAQANTLPELRC